MGPSHRFTFSPASLLKRAHGFFLSRFDLSSYRSRTASGRAAPVRIRPAAPPSRPNVAAAGGQEWPPCSAQVPVKAAAQGPPWAPRHAQVPFAPLLRCPQVSADGMGPLRPSRCRARPRFAERGPHGLGLTGVARVAGRTAVYQSLRVARAQAAGVALCRRLRPSTDGDSRTAGPYPRPTGVSDAETRRARTGH